MSFSGEIKQELALNVPRTQCCRRAAAQGIWRSAQTVDGARVVRFADPGEVAAFVVAVTELGYGKNRVSLSVHPGKVTEVRATGLPAFPADRLFDEACHGCAAAYFKGVFLVHGRVTAPAGGYFLEFDFDSEEDAAAFAEASQALIPGAKRFRRSGKEIVYYKESGAIEDIMAVLGSNRAAFEIMNHKIERQLRNDANRYSNCEAANLMRAVSNSRRQIEAIRRLTESGRLSQLSPELIETARLRAEHPELTLYELSKLTNPPVSKSGLNHRLNKILACAQELES